MDCFISVLPFHNTRWKCSLPTCGLWSRLHYLLEKKADVSLDLQCPRPAKLPCVRTHLLEFPGPHTDRAQTVALHSVEAPVCVVEALWSGKSRWGQIASLTVVCCVIRESVEIGFRAARPQRKWEGPSKTPKMPAHGWWLCLSCWDSWSESFPAPVTLPLPTLTAGLSRPPLFSSAPAPPAHGLCASSLQAPWRLSSLPPQPVNGGAALAKVRLNVTSFRENHVLQLTSLPPYSMF